MILIVKTQNNAGGFLTKRTLLSFEKQMHQQFNLIQDEEENSD